MQRKDDSPKTGRPSLLTPAQQAEADRNRILSTLETNGVVKPTRKPARRRQLMIGMGVLALALLIGAGAWLLRDAAQDHSALAAAAAAAPPAAAATAPAAPAEVSADEVLAAAPAATINDDPAARAAPEKQESLRDMLDANTAPAKSDHDALSKALESTPAVTRAAPKSAPKPAAAETARRVEKAKPKPAAKSESKAAQEPKPTPEQENDIALLSALVAHTQTLDAPETPAKAKPSLKQQLAQCKKFNKAKAEQCRERVCDGRSKTGECKVQR